MQQHVNKLRGTVTRPSRGKHSQCPLEYQKNGKQMRLPNVDHGRWLHATTFPRQRVHKFVLGKEGPPTHPVNTDTRCCLISISFRCNANCRGIAVGYPTSKSVSHLHNFFFYSSSSLKAVFGLISPFRTKLWRRTAVTTGLLFAAQMFL